MTSQRKRKNRKFSQGKKATLGRLLAIPAKSDRQEIAILLKVFALMAERAKETWFPSKVLSQTRDVLARLMLDSMKAKGIPTSEDRFAFLLHEYFLEPDPQAAQRALRRARQYIIGLNASYDRRVQKHWGKQGGRGRRGRTASATLSATVEANAVEILSSRLGKVFSQASRRRLVEAVAKRTPRYDKLNPSQKKNRKDFVRERLSINQWFTEQRGKARVNPKKLSNTLSS